MSICCTAIFDWASGDFPIPLIHGGGGGEGPAALIDRFLEMLIRGPEFPGGAFAGIEALGSNVHPLLVHFPIAFLMGFLVLEIAGLVFRSPGLRQIASGMLYLGSVGAIAAVVAGLIAEETVIHGTAMHEIMEWHKRTGIVVASLAVLLAVWRAVVRARYSIMGQTLQLLLSVIMVVSLFWGADLGGFMVYQFGVGVKSLQQPDSEHLQEHHLHLHEAE